MAVKSFRTQQFKHLLESLPESIQRQAEAAYEQFKQNSGYPGLQFKQVAPDIYSIRIGIHYRALGVRKNETIVWYWIGTHAEYDKLV
jgi:hypothetical protein